MKILRNIIAGVIMLMTASFAVGQTVYKIESVWSGKVLDVTNGSTDNGAIIQQWDFTGQGPWQNWLIEDAGDGTVVIRNAWTGKVLDVTNGSTDNGAIIQQWDYTGQGPWQNWLIEDAGDGTVVIRNAWTGKVLDVTWASGDNGAIIQQWDYTGAPWQQWRLTTPTPPPPTASHRIDIQDIAGGGRAVQMWVFYNGFSMKVEDFQNVISNITVIEDVVDSANTVSWVLTNIVIYPYPRGQEIVKYNKKATYINNSWSVSTQRQ